LFGVISFFFFAFFLKFIELSFYFIIDLKLIRGPVVLSVLFNFLFLIVFFTIINLRVLNSIIFIIDLEDPLLHFYLSFFLLMLLQDIVVVIIIINIEVNLLFLPHFINLMGRLFFFDRIQHYLYILSLQQTLHSIEEFIVHEVIER
jgi:hypothetical protein